LFYSFPDFEVRARRRFKQQQSFLTRVICDYNILNTLETTRFIYLSASSVLFTICKQQQSYYNVYWRTGNTTNDRCVYTRSRLARFRETNKTLCCIRNDIYKTRVLRNSLNSVRVLILFGTTNNNMINVYSRHEQIFPLRFHLFRMTYGAADGRFPRNMFYCTNVVI